MWSLTLLQSLAAFCDSTVSSLVCHGGLHNLTMRVARQGSTHAATFGLGVVRKLVQLLVRPL